MGETSSNGLAISNFAVERSGVDWCCGSSAEKINMVIWLISVKVFEEMWSNAYESEIKNIENQSECGLQSSFRIS